MTLTLDLPNDVLEALTQASRQQGQTPEQAIVATVREKYLPQNTPAPDTRPLAEDPTLALFAAWAEEDQTDDPQELMQRQRDWETLAANLQANRFRLPEGRFPIHPSDQDT